MKRPRPPRSKRPRTASCAKASNPREAAIHLVRLEFDAARLKMGITQAITRAASYQSDLKRNAAERKYLLDILKN